MSARCTAAMVFAAGRGQRMQPLSDRIPKPALPLPGGPLVAWSIRCLVGHGVGSLAVNLWHRAEVMAAAVADATAGYPGLQVGLSEEESLLGTAGGLALARDRGLLGRSGPVLVANGDVVHELDLEPLLDRHFASDDGVSMALLPHPDLRRWARVEVDRTGRVAAVVAAGDPRRGASTGYLYPGVMVVSREALDELPRGPGGLGSRLWEPWRKRGRLGAVEVSGPWREVGRPAEYLAAATAMLGDGSEVSERAAISAGAVITRSLVGHGVEVAPGVVVRDSVVADGARLEPGARVEASVLLGPVRVGPGEVVRGVYRAVPTGR